MSVSFFAQNVLESTNVTVTVCNASTSSPATRLYDRIRALQYAASSSGTLVNIDTTGAVHHPVGSVAVVNHNATTTAILYGSSDYVLFTSVATFNPVGVDPYWTTLPALSTEYLAWRVQFPANVTRLKIGELLLGCAQTVFANPVLGQITEGPRANRRDDESVGGYVRGVRLGASRQAYDMAWNTMSCNDWNSLSSAFATANDGATPFLLSDYNGTKLWAKFVSVKLDAQRVTTPLRGVRTEILEAL